MEKPPEEQDGWDVWVAPRWTIRDTLLLWFHTLLLALTVPVEWAGRAIDRVRGRR